MVSLQSQLENQKQVSIHREMHRSRIGFAEVVTCRLRGFSSRGDLSFTQFLSSSLKMGLVLGFVCFLDVRRKEKTNREDKIRDWEMGFGDWVKERCWKVWCLTDASQRVAKQFSSAYAGAYVKTIHGYGSHQVKMREIVKRINEERSERRKRDKIEDERTTISSEYTQC